MQSQRRILGVKWYDKDQPTGLKDLYLPSSPIDVTHFLATSANYPGTHLFPKHYIYPLMPSPAHLATTLSQRVDTSQFATLVGKFTQQLPTPCTHSPMTDRDFWLKSHLPMRLIISLIFKSNSSSATTVVMFYTNCKLYNK